MDFVPEYQIMFAFALLTKSDFVHSWITENGWLKRLLLSSKKKFFIENRVLTGHTDDIKYNTLVKKSSCVFFIGSWMGID